MFLIQPYGFFTNKIHSQIYYVLYLPLTTQKSVPSHRSQIRVIFLLRCPMCSTSTQSSALSSLFLSLPLPSHCFVLSFFHFVQLRYFTKTLVLTSHCMEWLFSPEALSSLHLLLQTGLCVYVLKTILSMCFLKPAHKSQHTLTEFCILCPAF